MIVLTCAPWSKVLYLRKTLGNGANVAIRRRYDMCIIFTFKRQYPPAPPPPRLFRLFGRLLSFRVNRYVARACTLQPGTVGGAPAVGGTVRGQPGLAV